jgi:hypothetical protein
VSRLMPTSAARAADKPDFSQRTAEACVWDANGRYARWLLPTHSGRPVLGPSEDFQKHLMGQRDRPRHRSSGNG